MTYRQLTQEDRIRIHTLLQQNYSIRRIASILSRCPSTIYREIRRNSGERGYRHQQANNKAVERRKYPRKIKMTETVIRHIVSKIRQQFSPEQISNTMASSVGLRISHEWIYQYLWNDKRNGGTLYRHCRIAGNKCRRKRYGTHSRRGKIHNRRDIDLRPKIVDEKRRIGDWEADTIVGEGHRGAIVTVVERKSKLTRMMKIERNTATLASRAIIQLLRPYSDCVHTITFDNGREFSEHERIASALKCDCYFAKPYHSWERGLNENTNGLIRQYIPKKSDFRLIDNNHIAIIEDRLNNRPRKTLGYKTPNEVIGAGRR
mgnify:CR=1 FL=1